MASEPTTIDELHARYKLARQNIDGAGLAHVAANIAAPSVPEFRRTPIRIAISEPESAGAISVEVTSIDASSVTITSNRVIETRALLRAVTAVMREPRRITVERILREVCKEYGVTQMDLKSHRRMVNLVRPRHVVAFLSRTMTDRSFPEIGRRLGNRDHTTILHGYRKMQRLLETDTELQDRIAKITAELGGPISE